jgi:hypothetical protein
MNNKKIKKFLKIGSADAMAQVVECLPRKSEA